MNAEITCDQPNGAAKEKGTGTRTRRPLPPQEARDWMTPHETALARQYGQRFVFRKASVARWQDDNEKKGPRLVSWMLPSTGSAGSCAARIFRAIQEKNE
jgi:hypothetical protein